LFQISLAGHSPNGQSYLLYSEKDLPRAQELIDIKNELKQPIEPELYTIADKQFAMQTVPRRRLTLFEILPEVSEEIEVKFDKSVDSVCLDPEDVKEVPYAEQYVEVVQSQGHKQDLLKVLLAKYILHMKNEQNERKVLIFAQNDKIKNLTAFINNSISDKSRMAVGLVNNSGPEQRKEILDNFHKSGKQTLVTSNTFFEKLGDGKWPLLGKKHLESIFVSCLRSWQCWLDYKL
jgi:superfamily II DNA/RNA helicase